jgi:pimeloyl-ACP methyl ester carboxylesterase
MEKQALRSRLSILFLALTFFQVPSNLHAQSWRLEDMSPPGLSSAGTSPIVDVLLLPGMVSCGEPDCKFVLHYFNRDSLDSFIGSTIRLLSNFFGTGDRGERKTILYIIGGPGQIVDRRQRDLEFLEDKHNVIYFDIRGTGLSAIPLQNSYDRFLRARYVVEDIEVLRQKALGDKPWDAIFAHSHGTLIAQTYAAHRVYGSRVKKLVLSAPVSRNLDFEDARIKMIAGNLRTIYQSYSSNGCGCDAIRGDRPFPDIQTAEEIFGREMGGTDNFCFLKESRIETITKKLEDHLKDLKKDYGSASFVLGNFDDLIDRSNYFKENHPYPKVFYRALQTLQFTGAADKNPLFTNEHRKERLVNLGYLLGYFLTMPDALLKMPDFYNVSFPKAAPFLKENIEGFDESPVCSSRYANRVFAAKASLDSVRTNRSRRAASVSGIFDGSSQWVFHTLKSGLSCFTGNDIKEYVALPSDEKSQFGRQFLGVLGLDLDAKICPWNPKDNAHEVPTLILSGGGDPITAGCQAEFFFNQGLTIGKRVLIKFRKMGHILIPTVNKQDERLWREALSEVIGTFIESNDVTQFRGNSKVRSMLKYPLDAADQTPDVGSPINYQSCEAPS